MAPLAHFRLSRWRVFLKIVSNNALKMDQNRSTFSISKRPVVDCTIPATKNVARYCIDQEQQPAMWCNAPNAVVPGTFVFVPVFTAWLTAATSC